jgi:hypothetical protein
MSATPRPHIELAVLVAKLAADARCSTYLIAACRAGEVPDCSARLPAVSSGAGAGAVELQAEVTCDGVF